MQAILCSINPPINQELLREQLSSNLPGIFLGLDNGGPNQIAVVLTDSATAGNITTARNVCSAHDGTQLSAAQQKANSDAASVSYIRSQWHDSPLHNKTPQQIFTTMQVQIDAWSTLAQAKSDLRVWLPLLFAALAWTEFKDQQRD